MISCHWLRSGRAALLVALLAVVAFIPAVHYGFVWDDVLLIQKNQFLQRDNLGSLLSRDFTELTFGALGGGLYRPLFALSLWVDAGVWGLRPEGFQVTNLILHGLVVVLLWLVVRRLRDPLTAILTVALFAVHPAHSEVAAFISGRVDSLALIPMLGGLWIFLQLGDRRSAWVKGLLHSGLAGTTVLALVAKESAVVFPGLLLIVGLTGAAGAGGQLAGRVRDTLWEGCRSLVVVGGLHADFVLHDAHRLPLPCFWAFQYGAQGLDGGGGVRLLYDAGPGANSPRTREVSCGPRLPLDSASIVWMGESHGGGLLALVGLGPASDRCGRAALVCVHPSACPGRAPDY